MPLLLTEAALEAHQRELEQDPQPVLLYGALSPRHSPQRLESAPPARGGFAGFFGSLVSSIGKRGVLGGLKLSAQPTSGCASPILKEANVSQFSNFSQGSRLERFLTDSAKSAIIADSALDQPSLLEGGLSKSYAKFDRSSHLPQAKAFPAKEISENHYKGVSRRTTALNSNSSPTLAPAHKPTSKASSSSGNSHVNSASSLSSDDAIRHTSLGLKSASAQALLSTSIQAPTLSEIRSRISLLEGSREKQPAQVTSNATNNRLPEQKPLVSEPSTSCSNPSVTSPPSSGNVLVSEPLPPYALLQSAPLALPNRSKWKQSNEVIPATKPSQGGWHYRSVQNSNSSPDQHALDSAIGVSASAPSWLKLANPLSPVSSASASSPVVESSGARSSRRQSIDSTLAPNLVSSDTPVLDQVVASDKSVFVESVAAAQRRAKQNAFVQHQRLSPTKIYTKDSVSAAPLEVCPVAVDSGTSGRAQSNSVSHISPGQVFSSLKVSVSNVKTVTNDLAAQELKPKLNTTLQETAATRTASGHIFESLKITESSQSPRENSLSTKEIGQQLSQDLSERLQRIQRANIGHRSPEHKQEQSVEPVTSFLKPHHESSSKPSVESSAAATPVVSIASTSFASDSLQEFVSKLNHRSAASSVPQRMSSIPVSCSHSLTLNTSGHTRSAPLKVANQRSNGIDSLDAFVSGPSASSSSFSSPATPAQSSTQVQSRLHKQMPNKPDEVCLPEKYMKPLQHLHSVDTAAVSKSESSVVQAVPNHSLYRVDSSSPLSHEFDSSKPKLPIPTKSASKSDDDDEYQFDNSWLFSQRATATPAAVGCVSGPLTAVHQTPDFGQMRDSKLHSDVSPWLSPAVSEPFLPPFDFDNSNCSSPLKIRNPNGTNVATAAHDHVDDFVPSFEISHVLSKPPAISSANNVLMSSINNSNCFKPVTQEISTHALAESAQYIVRDSKGINLLASALHKVYLPNCPSLSKHALNQLLNPILRTFDFVAFADKVKVPALVAADLVQLAPFRIHFVVDDSGDSLKFRTHWKDAQTLLEECLDFVSLVNNYGCTLTFLSSSITQTNLKSRNEVAALFAKVDSNASSKRFVVASKPDVVASFEAHVFDPVFAQVAPSLVYVLSLQDSVTKRNHLSVEGMLSVLRALDARLSKSGSVPGFVRLSVANVGEGILDGCSSLLSEMRSNAVLASRLTFIEDFECDFRVCEQQGVELTPHIYVLKMLLCAVDSNYLN